MRNTTKQLIKSHQSAVYTLFLSHSLSHTSSMTDIDIKVKQLLVSHTATHCNTLQHTATHCNTLQHTAAHCNTLQHTATHCNTLQHTAAHCSTLQHTATHCNTLQYTAIHCNTLHHTATVSSHATCAAAPSTGRTSQQSARQSIYHVKCPQS